MKTPYAGHPIKFSNISYQREVIASYPCRTIAIHLTSDKKKSIGFKVTLDSQHDDKKVEYKDGMLVLSVSVKKSIMKGMAGARIVTDGKLIHSENEVTVSDATTATIYLSAATNFKNYNDVRMIPIRC